MVVSRNIATRIISILISPNTEHQKHHWGITRSFPGGKLPSGNQTWQWNMYHL